MKNLVKIGDVMVLKGTVINTRRVVVDILDDEMFVVRSKAQCSLGSLKHSMAIGHVDIDIDFHDHRVSDKEIEKFWKKVYSI